MEKRKLHLILDLSILLRILFVLLVCINFLAIIFVSGIIYITLMRVIDTNVALSFLSQVSTLPNSAPTMMMIKPILWFIGLLIFMSIGRFKPLNKKENRTISVICIFCCVYIMYCLQFANNSIMLLFIAYVLYTNKDNSTRFIFLSISIVLYLFSNDNVLSFMRIISLDEFISCYNTTMQSMLNIVNNFLIMLNIIIFIMYMFVMILEEVNESKRVMQLNEELKELNQQLQEFASIQEKMGETKERNRLAREIHDTLGHTLTGLSVGIDAAMMILDMDSDTTKKQLAVLSQTARQGLKDVRRSVEKLRPDALERYSLQEALEKMIIDFEVVSKVNINFVCHLESLSFNSDEEEVIYRIIQEGLTNALRHGHAENVFISFALENNVLLIIIEDDGIGCQKVEYGFGLHHMEERIKILHGKLRAYGHDGFVIIAEIPLRKEDTND
ncbi:MAG: sensor histidine kinase [Erysipelotrichia bacterium]|nr:sensor histidine kinase [Erysipelotrichia bacterium]